MSISQSSGSVYTDLSGLEQLKYKLKGNSVEDLRVAAQQFEALFIQQMLKTMREAKLSDGVFDSNEGDMYVDMLDKQLSLDLSKGKGLGLADIIVSQLSHTLNTASEPGAVLSESSGNSGGQPTSNATFQKQSEPPVTSTPKISGQGGAAQTGADKPQVKPSLKKESSAVLSSANTPKFSNPQEFIKTLWPLAVKASRDIGVAPPILIAQAALETGWGQYIAQDGSGRSSHNLFNIKAGAHWQGDTVTLATTELRNGTPVKEYAAFRSYDSYNASFEDYVSLIKQNPRYRQALQLPANAKEYASALQKAGYATDPAYAEKVAQIANGIPLKI